MLSVGKLEAMTRTGFAARGIMYFLIGYLTLSTGRAEDGPDALAYLSSGAGRLLLALMAIGFAAYGMWRLIEAAVDTEGHGDDAKGMAVRTGGIASGLVHLSLAFLAGRLAFGTATGSANGEGAPEAGAATALTLPGGSVLIAAISIALVGTGLYQLVKAARADFLRHLDGKAARQPLIEWMGRAGYAARGIVFLMIGWFLWQAARQAEAAEAGGVEEAMASLPAPFQVAVAAGLLLFGLFSLVEARYRRINDPAVVARLRNSIADGAAGFQRSRP